MDSQRSIGEALAEMGYEVTQATISRDLDAIGAVRVKSEGKATYRLGRSTASADEMAMNEAYGEFVSSSIGNDG